MTDAPANSREGMERLLNWARKSNWKLLPSTKAAAERLGIDTTGVEFVGATSSAQPGESA